jgi:hypothetical protein
VSILSYAGELSLGLNLDTAFCKGPNDADEILNLWIEQIYQMAHDSDSAALTQTVKITERNQIIH